MKDKQEQIMEILKNIKREVDKLSQATTNISIYKSEKGAIRHVFFETLNVFKKIIEKKTIPDPNKISDEEKLKKERMRKRRNGDYSDIEITQNKKLEKLILKEKEYRKLNRKKAQSVRTISGGLPSLGKKR
ncbi:hypothetical protein N8901_00160 [Gammaproteobacteria bacterium]|nr:hypothetical protein [Gammaproteobacteria bacterium]